MAPLTQSGGSGARDPDPGAPDPADASVILDLDGDRPAYAVAWSGGKDSLHALHRAERWGYPVTHLFNIYEESSGRVRFHGIRRELVAHQAEALGLEMVQEGSRPDGFEAAFHRTLDRLLAVGVRGVIFGNVHLEEIRAWYETRTTSRGLEHVEPLWGEASLELVRQFLALGYRSTVVSVDTSCGDPDWVGRELSLSLLRRFVMAGNVDPCGERGEYHTFAWDGPRFLSPVRFKAGETMEREGHRFLDLIPAIREEKG